jgi:hypothetical protein
MYLHTALHNVTTQNIKILMSNYTYQSRNRAGLNGGAGWTTEKKGLDSK